MKICFKDWSQSKPETEGLEIYSCNIRSLVKSVQRKFLTKTSVVGTQKNCLNETVLVNETVLLSTQNIYLNWWVRKYLNFYAVFFFFFVYLSLWIMLLFGPRCSWENLSLELPTWQDANQPAKLPRKIIRSKLSYNTFQRLINKDFIG